jgi:hypothetical protein
MINAPTTLVIAIFAGIAVFAVVGWLLAMKTARKEIEHSKALVKRNRELTDAANLRSAWRTHRQESDRMPDREWEDGIDV